VISSTKIWWPSSEGEDSSNSQTWVDKLVFSGTIENEDDYDILVNAEITGDRTNTEIEVRATIDDIERAYNGFIPQQADLYHGWTSNGVIHLTAGFHELKIQYRSSSPQQTMKIRRARAILEKF
jgi:tetrahydromethanopterin S-methyltransferase subunit F